MDDSNHMYGKTAVVQLNATRSQIRQHNLGQMCSTLWQSRRPGGTTAQGTVCASVWNFDHITIHLEQRMNVGIRRMSSANAWTLQYEHLYIRAY